MRRLLLGWRHEADIDDFGQLHNLAVALFHHRLHQFIARQLVAKPTAQMLQKFFGVCWLIR